MTSKWFQRWFGPEPEEQPVESNLVAHAQRELMLAGLFDSDADYDGEVGSLVLELVKTFSSFGHSGGSAMLTLSLFERLVQFKTLAPITNNPDEWIEVGPEVWQNCRQGSVFSVDAGKTFYDIDEPMTGEEHAVYKSKEYISA
jgi:hypothetical protein